MPITIPIIAEPTQQFSTVQDGQRYDVTLRTIPNGMTLATVARNGAMVIENVRVVSNRLIIPYRYKEGTGGNFFLAGDGDTLPDYKQFGSTQVLLYYSAAELAAERAAA